LTDDERSVPPARPTLRPSLVRLSEAALALLRSRGELAAIEYAEERERLKRSALTLAVALLMLAFALGGAGMWVVVYFWDTGRLTAIAFVTLVYAVLAVVLWRVDVAQSEAEPAPFAGTLAEFEKDRAWLARQAQPRSPGDP
jgi:uncharacterized membrane protein YqjE